MYEYSWLLAAYLISVSREGPKTASQHDRKTTPTPKTAVSASVSVEKIWRCSLFAQKWWVREQQLRLVKSAYGKYFSG